MEQNELNLIRNLSDLRDLRTKGKPSHDLKQRLYEDLDNPKNLDADCANSIYDFSYDPKGLEGNIEAVKKEVEQSFSTKIQELKNHLLAMEKQLSEIKVEKVDLKKVAPETLDATHQSLSEIALTRAELVQKVALLKIEIGEEEIKMQEEIALKTAAIVVPTMHEEVREIYPGYIAEKTALPLYKALLKEVEKHEKEALASAETYNLINIEYAKLTKSVGINAVEVAENTAASYRLGYLKPFIYISHRLQASIEIAKFVIFNGVASKKSHRIIKKCYMDKAEAHISSILENIDIKNADLHQQQVTYQRNAIDKEEAANVARRVEEEKKNITSWPYEVFTSAELTSSNEYLKVIKDYENTSAKLIKEKDEGVSAIIAKYEKQNQEFKAPVFSSSSLKTYEESKTSLQEKIDDKSIEYKESLSAVKNLFKIAKQIYADEKKHSQAVISYVSKRMDLAYQQAKEIHGQILVLNQKLAEARDVRDSALLKVGEKILKAEHRSIYGSYLNAISANESIDDKIVANKVLYDEIFKAESKELEYRSLKTEAKYGALFNNIYRKMDIDRLGISCGRVLDHEKLINSRYEHLAKLQNKTKLVQQSQKEEEMANVKTFELEKIENNNNYEIRLKKLQHSKLYYSDYIVGGSGFAKALTSIRAHQLKTELKSAEIISDEGDRANIKKESATSTKNNWVNSSEISTKLMINHCQTTVNKRFLQDAEAIKVRRFSLKYTLKKIITRIFVIVIVCTVMGLIDMLGFKNALIGFIIGVCLATLVEFAKFFLSPICYIMPKNGGLNLYTRSGEMMFELSESDIVNEVLLPKRAALLKIIPQLVGYQVLVESGADIFRFSIVGKQYKKILLHIHSEMRAKEIAANKEAIAKLKAESKAQKEETKNSKVQVIK